MRLLLISHSVDNGGNGSALKRAIERNTDWQVRYVRRRGSFLGYEADIEWPRKTPMPPEVLDAWERADVVMMLGSFSLAQAFPGYERKPKVMYHLGQGFRDNAASYMTRCRAEGIPQLVTTFDLMGYAPDLHWLPMICDTGRMERERAAYRQGPRVRVMQTPAARGPNHTDAFVAAVSGVGGVDVSLIEGMSWPEALQRKAQADILFDSFDSWYGLSAIEAMGMGVPVIVGSDNADAMARMQATVGEPCIRSTRETVASVVGALADDPSLRLRYGEMGREIAHRFHAEARVVERLAPFFEMAMDRAVAA